VFFVAFILNICGEPLAKSLILIHSQANDLNQLSTDLNLDGVVNILDLCIVARSWNSHLEDLGWNPRADVNGDGTVNVLDMVLIAKDFGKTSSPAAATNVGFYASSWNFKRLTAEQIASSFDMSQSWCLSTGVEYVAKMNQVKVLDPAYKALVYRNVLAIYRSYPYDSEWDWANSNGWLLKDANGNYLVTWSGENYMADITNRGYQMWVANTIKSWIQQYSFFDGVMVDNSLFVNARQWESIGGGRAVNPRTGAYFTDDEVLTGCTQLLNEIISAVGPSKLVLPNGIWNGDLFFGNAGYNTVLSSVTGLNALGSEAPFYEYKGQWYTEEQWLSSIDMIVYVQDNFLKGHPERRFNAWCSIDEGYGLLPPGTTKEQLMMFGFCSMLLGIENADQNFIGFGEDLDLFPDLVTQLQKVSVLDIGVPSSGYYKNGSAYTRDFSNCIVFVNPTSTICTVTLQGVLRTLDGSTVQGNMQIGSHTGVLLFK
jgi:hypothetical protein